VRRALEGAVGVENAVSQELLRKASEAGRNENVPEFRIGDTVRVSVRIVEGEKERIQVFAGTVIARKGSGVSETFTVRRIVNNEGVERVFPTHSPKIADIEVVRSGRVRRAKLYYLRQRVGKKTRLKEVARPTKRQLAAGAAGDEAEQQAEGQELPESAEPAESEG
jgi:large subunit ribosomal protein L19